MKVVAVNGSPRKTGNTSIMLNWALEAIKSEGLETELINIGGASVPGCKACGACGKKQNRRCIQDKDPANEIMAGMFEADGIILGSPVYFADITPELKALIDRAGFVALQNGGLLKRKAGAAVTVARRAGQVHAYDSINHFFGINNMFTVGSSYWNLGVGLEAGDVEKDAEAAETMRNLGANMAWLIKKCRQGS